MWPDHLDPHRSGAPRLAFFSPDPPHPGVAPTSGLRQAGGAPPSPCSAQGLRQQKSDQIEDLVACNFDFAATGGVRCDQRE